MGEDRVNFLRNWKTTVSGILALAAAGTAIYHDPKTAANPDTIAAILAGVGLIAAKDGNVSGPPPSPVVK